MTVISKLAEGGVTACFRSGGEVSGVESVMVIDDCSADDCAVELVLGELSRLSDSGALCEQPMVRAASKFNVNMCPQASLTFFKPREGFAV